MIIYSNSLILVWLVSYRIGEFIWNLEESVMNFGCLSRFFALCFGILGLSLILVWMNFGCPFRFLILYFSNLALSFILVWLNSTELVIIFGICKNLWWILGCIFRFLALCFGNLGLSLILIGLVKFYRICDYIWNLEEFVMNFGLLFSIFASPFWV